MNRNELALRLKTLVLFRRLLADPAVAAFTATLAAEEPAARAEAYAAFAAALYAAGGDDWFAHLQRLVEDDENEYIRCVGAGRTPPPHFAAALQNELAVLEAAAAVSPAELKEGIPFADGLPGYTAAAPGDANFAALYADRAANLHRYGYGLYARYTMFYLDDTGRILPVRHPDAIRLHNLIDYKREQGIILENTRALLAGKPAANMLLTGDAGTGKSSTVKAVVNELAGEGLRIIQLQKEQLRLLPALLDELSENPLKFILFIDDLSFQKGDDQFSSLKAVLEGSVSAKSRNVVIYATSNRRHLVKERFSDREGDDIHRNDTMQEILSLSERFGIRVTFQRPDKQVYLDIVHALANEAGLTTPTDQLDALAERFALSQGNRSARAARQVVDRLLSGDSTFS